MRLTPQFAPNRPRMLGAIGQSTLCHTNSHVNHMRLQSIAIEFRTFEPNSGSEINAKVDMCLVCRFSTV